MITLQDVKHLGITNRDNVISDLDLLNEHLGKLIDFKKVDDVDEARIFYPAYDKRDDSGVTYTFGGYYGRMNYRLSNADILEWRDSHPECVWAGRVRDVILMNESELSTYVGMQHCAELVAYEINCVASALSDMGQNVKINELLFSASNSFHSFADLVLERNLSTEEELKEAADIITAAFYCGLFHIAEY